jgi:hypothetical protein
VLGYPTHSLSTLHPLVGYPSAILKCYRATVKANCARILTARGKPITFASGAGFHSRQVHTEVRYLVRGNSISGGRSILVSGFRCLFENGNSKKFSQYFLSKLSFDKLSWLIVISPCLTISFGFLAKIGFSQFKCEFSWNKQPILHLVRVLRENGILGLKNENPCFKNFFGVLGSRFRLGGSAESQGFLEVKLSKYQNGFLTMSSPDHKLSRTIFRFTIG